jgi:outer membrane protein assembly factor BamB
VAIAGDVVIMATLDAKLVAFGRRTGTIAWETTIDDYAAGFSATSAPLVIGDVAVIDVVPVEIASDTIFAATDTDDRDITDHQWCGRGAEPRCIVVDCRFPGDGPGATTKRHPC